MKIITGNPVILNGVKQNTNDYYLGFDAKNTDEVKAFQDWLDIFYPTWLKGGKLNKGAGYGSYGPSTKAMEGKIAEFEKVTGKSTTATPLVDTKAPTPQEVEKQKKLGKVWDASKKAFVFAKESGILDTLLGKLGIQKQDTSAGQTPVATSTETQTETGSGQPPKEGMSTTTKIVLIGGGVVLLGVIIYFATKSNTPTKK